MQPREVEVVKTSHEALQSPRQSTDDEDAHEHVRTILEIVDLFHFPGVTHDVVMLRVFPITLKGRALRWKKGLPIGVINTLDLLEKEFIWQYCLPFKTAKKLEEIQNFKQDMYETLYQDWERYNDLLFKCPQHDLNNHQKVQIFYTGLDISTCKLLDSRGFITLMTPTQALKSIQVIADHSHNWARQLSREKNSRQERQWVRTRETICMIENPKEVHKTKAQEYEGDTNVVQPYMPLGLVHDKEKIVKDEEQDNDIPLQDHVMQPLTPQTVHITPPDDDYVAPATNPILDKQLNRFKKEFFDITRVAKKENCNPVNNVKELSDIKKYDCETFTRKLLHQVPAVRRQILRPSQPIIVW
ncbi:hypothetical protein Tco_1362056 [Tanacetum coccineum]